VKETGRFSSCFGTPMHAEHNSVMENPSVNLSCLSVCHTLVLYSNECTYCQTLSTVW